MQYSGHFEATTRFGLFVQIISRRLSCNLPQTIRSSSGSAYTQIFLVLCEPCFGQISRLVLEDRSFSQNPGWPLGNWNVEKCYPTGACLVVAKTWNSTCILFHWLSKARWLSMMIQSEGDMPWRENMAGVCSAWKIWSWDLGSVLQSLIEASEKSRSLLYRTSYIVLVLSHQPGCI